MPKLIKLLLCGVTALLFAGNLCRADSFIDEHPSLKDFLFKEPASDLYFSVGVSPLSLMNNGVMFSFSPFQLHLIKKEFDLELLSATIGFGLTKDSLTSSRKILVRTIPKLRISSVLSIGPIIGLEFVNYPNVNTKLFSGSQITPTFQPFSQVGYVLGLVASQVFVLNEQFQLRLNEMVYQENYSVTTSSNKWSYFYQDSSLQASTAAIQASTVIAMEFCLMF